MDKIQYKDIAKSFLNREIVEKVVVDIEGTPTMTLSFRGETYHINDELYWYKWI